MLARTWGGRVPSQQAASFHRHLLATGIARAEATEGCLGATLLRREAEGRAHFTLVTFWRDEAAVAAFAQGTAAIGFPGDAGFDLEPDTQAVHHAVLLDVRFPTP